MTQRATVVFLIKVGLTIPVTYALAYPFFGSVAGNGIIGEVERLGILGSVILATVFIALVFLYCRDLQRSLLLVRPSVRTASPRSVWLMFLIPYNFIEDFFIISNVTNSLRREAQQNAALGPFKHFGYVSGLGWCFAQIVSLLPNEIGTAAGFLAIPLWIMHWRLIRKLNAVLAAAVASSNR